MLQPCDAQDHPGKMLDSLAKYMYDYIYVYV